MRTTSIVGYASRLVYGSAHAIGSLAPFETEDGVHTRPGAEKVFKIGMTRRLDPMERIIELGGSSVPFPFDLHAMLYSDNAPELENGLHRLFVQRRLNMVNPRREFYRDVELNEIESFVKAKGLSAQFIKDAEAREYRETLAKREQAAPAVPEPDKFSGGLFHTATDVS
jgi:hypothetical protein